MKKLFYLTCAVGALLLYGCCCDDSDKIPEVNGNALRVTKVEAEASEESKAEIEKIGQDGFRLIEYDAEKLLQQSIWKNKAGTWAPESVIQPVDGGHIAAVYPAGEVQEGNERIFKAGVNNMYSVLDIDRKTTNEAAIAFKHAMCQVQLNIIDKNGKKIQFGTGNGKVNAIKLTQPAEVKYNIYEGQPVEIGAMQEMDFDISSAAYVVPGGKNYQFNAVYKNIDGKDIMYTYDFEVALVRNKKYLVDLRMDTEEESVLNVSVTVEEWDVEEIEAELIKDEEETTDDFMEFVEIPAGDFMMGSPEDQYGAWANEKPQHHVNISAFKMGKYEVTFDQYDKFCEETGAEKMDDNGWGRGDRPVIFVNWKEANEFCDWLGKKLGATVRLPTEAEWEYACRAGSTTKFFWGNNENGYDDYAWCSSNLGWRGPTQPVGQKKPNAFGLYDICGNVEEWCSDWASWNYNWAPKESTDPTGPENPITDDDGVFYQKVYRGGCYYKSSGTLYSSKRGSNTPEPEIRQSTVGFRVVMDIDD